MKKSYPADFCPADYSDDDFYPADVRAQPPRITGVKLPRPKPETPPKPMTFEEAMQFLRRGRSIQRRAWNVNSMIFALSDKVFIKLPNGHEAYGSAPTFWKPYPQDFLADDWRVVK